MHDADEPPTSDVRERAEQFDHLDPACAEGIHDFLGALRRECPVAHSNKHDGFHIVSKRDDLLEVGKSPERFSAWVEGLGAVMLLPEFARTRATLFEQDPPEHTGWRRFMQRFFGEAEVAKHEPYIREVTRRVIAELEGRDGAELVSELAVRVPPVLVAALLGYPEDQRERVSALARGFFGAGSLDPESAERAVREYAELLAELVEARRGADGDDLFTAVANAEIDGRAATDTELLKFAFLMVAAGHLTTSDSVANLLLALAEDPALQRRVRADLSLVPALVEEGVRHEAAVAATGRTVRCDTELGGVALQEGERVLLAWGSGARDEEHFDHGDTLDLERELPRRHIGWGAGSHQCIGIHLARLELRVILEEVLTTLPEFRLAPGATIERTYGVIRGVRALPVVWCDGDEDAAP